MASIFAAPYTLSSYLAPTAITTTAKLSGNVTIPDPGFNWTPIVLGFLGAVSSSAQAVPYVEARLGTSLTGVRVAGGCGNRIDSGAGDSVEISPAYDAGATAPVLSGSQTISVWLGRASGSGTLAGLSSSSLNGVVIYVLPTD